MLQRASLSHGMERSSATVEKHDRALALITRRKDEQYEQEYQYTGAQRHLVSRFREHRSQ